MSKHWNPRSGSGSRSYRSRRLQHSWGSTLLGGLFLAFAYVLIPLGGMSASEDRSPASWGRGAGPGESPVDVTIIDGDTFRYRGEKIRVADIDTPEVNGRCDYERALAARATRRMDALLREGPFELHPVERDEDRYGRKLRIVTRDGRSLGDQLVSEGLARTCTGRREPWCGNEA